jgi:hypothetical protein
MGRAIICIFLFEKWPMTETPKVAWLKINNDDNKNNNNNKNSKNDDTEWEKPRKTPTRVMHLKGPHIENVET